MSTRVRDRVRVRDRDRVRARDRASANGAAPPTRAFWLIFSSSKDPGDEKANGFLGFSKKAKKAVKVIGDVIVNGIVKVNGIYPYCSRSAAMRGANACAAAAFCAAVAAPWAHFLPGISSKSRWRGEPADASSENVRRVWRIRRFFARKKKWGWISNTQITLSTSKIVAARRKECEWHLGTFRTIPRR